MTTPNGVVVAGHPATAEAGAEILRAGGNAVDAAACAALTAMAVESPLTALGGGGFMALHTPAGADHLLDFFVEAPGRGIDPAQRTELVPATVIFDETPQTFHIGAASCGVPGTGLGLWEAVDRFGSVPFAELTKPAIRLAREGSRVSAVGEYLSQLLEPVHDVFPETRALYHPGGRHLREGDLFRYPELADGLERLAQDGPEPFYRGEVARAVSEWVLERGGLMTLEDLAAYRVIEREPAHASYRGREVLTNPPPSSGGILVVYCLALLERFGELPPAGDPGALRLLVEVMEQANAERTDGFSRGLQREGFLGEFLAPEYLEAARGAIAERLQSGPAPARVPPGDAVGSTTHCSAIDAQGGAASVTASNGTGSGMLVPGTGVHLNNILGEEDLNPLGFHTQPPGTRMTSMMAPTLVLRDGEVEMALGTSGSNRIRSAILQVVMGALDRDLPVDEAVLRGRVHYENGVLHSEPGHEAQLDVLERLGYVVTRWRRLNMFFGGCQAAARDPASGAASGGGDPRRDGRAVAVG